MEVDYIRRKPLITVPVEVVVGGEGAPGPRVHTCQCVFNFLSQSASLNLNLTSWMLFWLSIFSQSQDKNCIRRSGNITTVSSQQTVNTTRKCFLDGLVHARDTQFSHILVLYHHLSLDFSRESPPAAPQTIKNKLWQNYGGFPMRQTDFRAPSKAFIICSLFTTSARKTCLLMNNGLSVRFCYCLVNNASMFSRLKYQRVLWSDMDSCRVKNFISEICLLSPVWEMALLTPWLTSNPHCLPPIHT